MLQPIGVAGLPAAANRQTGIFLNARHLDLFSSLPRAVYTRNQSGERKETKIPPNLIIDAADSAFEADERNGGHVVYVTMRRTWYAQLTFWSPPAPRL